MASLRVQKWQEELERLSNEYNAALAGIDKSRLNTKPNATSWSIAEVMDHVIKTNESYYPVIEQLQAGTHKVPGIGKIGFINHFFGNFILKAVEPSRKKKIKTFPIWEPSASNIDANILEHFKQHQNELSKRIGSCEGLVEKGALLSSPANKNIVYKLDKAFDILVAHEQRHLNQVKEIKGLL